MGKHEKFTLNLSVSQREFPIKKKKMFHSKSVKIKKKMNF